MTQPPYAGPAEPYYAPGWQQPTPTTDRLAIASLVSAVVGLAPVGIGLGIAALVRTRRRGTRGRGLAIAGIAVGVAWTLVAVALVAIAVTTAIGSRPLPADVPEARDARAVALVPGNCLDPLPADGDVDAVRVVPCAQPHAAQVISQYDFAADAVWPGQAAADRRVGLACEVSPAETEAGLVARSWAPTKRSWDRGDRTGLCLLHRSDGAPLSGSLLTGTADLS